MGVSGRRPPSCVRGAPTVLKGAAAAVRTAGTRGSTPPGTGEAAEETAAGATTPGEKACCMDGIAASAGTEVAWGTSFAAEDVSHSASTDSDSIRRSRCATSNAAGVHLMLRISSRSKPSPRPSSCTRKAAATQRPERPTERGRMPPRRDVRSADETESSRGRTENTPRGTPQF